MLLVSPFTSAGGTEYPPLNPAGPGSRPTLKSTSRCCELATKTRARGIHQTRSLFRRNSHRRRTGTVHSNSSSTRLPADFKSTVPMVPIKLHFSRAGSRWDTTKFSVLPSPFTSAKRMGSSHSNSRLLTLRPRPGYNIAVPVPSQRMATSGNSSR